MANKTFVSPIGASAEEVAQERAERSTEYRAKRERLAFWSDIAAQIILYRTRQGISQAELAEKVETSYSAISRLESGQHATNVETLSRVAQALGLHLRIQLEPAGDRQARSRVQAPGNRVARASVGQPVARRRVKPRASSSSAMPR